MKKIVFIDMDDTIADFLGAKEFAGGFDVAKMYEPGFFLSLKPIEGSQVAVRQIMRMGFDVQILTQPLAESAHSYVEKVQWIALHFPDLINKINMTQDKGLFKGSYLVDDNLTKWKDKFEANGGKFVHFQYYHDSRLTIGNRGMWERIVNFFADEVKRGLESTEEI